MRVRCINDIGLESDLSEGAVYEVVKETNTHYHLKSVAIVVFKWRFEILTLPCPAPAYPCADPFACGQELPKPAALPAECKCGILRSMCDYHRD